MDLEMEFDPNQKAKEFVVKIITDSQLPEETTASLFINSQVVDQNKVMMELGINEASIVEIKLRQIAEITATNRIQNHLTFSIDLWEKNEQIKQAILRQLHSLHDYYVELTFGDYELESDDLCFVSNIRANSIILYRLVIQFNISINQEIQNLQIDAYTTIRELRELIKQLYSIEEDFQLEYEGALIENSDYISLFSYSITPGNTIYLITQNGQPQHQQIIHEPIIQQQIEEIQPDVYENDHLKIFLCNQAEFADEREITVKTGDQINVLDGEIKDPNIQIVYSYAGHTLDRNQSFQSQNIPANAKIRYLLSIQAQKIKVFFENQFNNEMLESLVSQDEQIYIEISKQLQLSKSQISQLYEIIYNQEEIKNLDTTYKSLGISFGSTITLRFKSIEVEVYYRTKRYSWPFQSEATVGEVLQFVEEKFQITDSELYQNDKRLPLDKLIKEIYQQPFNLIESGDKNNEYFHQTKEIILFIQPLNFEILITVNSDDTVKSLLNKLKRDQGMPLNQPMILKTLQGAELNDEDCVDFYNQLNVELFDYLILKFENLLTKETHQDLVSFEEQIKVYAQTHGLHNCTFFHSNKKLNPNESFKANLIYNNDTIQYQQNIDEKVEIKQKEGISLNFKYQKKNAHKYEPETKIENVNIDQRVIEFQNDLKIKFNLDDDTVLVYQQKHLPLQQTLKECKIENNSTITAVNEVYTLQIKDLNQKIIINQYLRPSERISALKSKLEKKINSTNIVFKYEGKILNEANTLKELGIGNQSVIEINY